MRKVWVEGLIIGLCIGIAAVLIQSVATTSLLLRIMLLVAGGVMLSLLQYAVSRLLR